MTETVTMLPREDRESTRRSVIVATGAQPAEGAANTLSRHQKSSVRSQPCPLAGPGNVGKSPTIPSLNNPTQHLQQVLASLATPVMSSVPKPPRREHVQ